MWSKLNRLLPAVLCLWALVVWLRPLPPKCPLPSGSDAARYDSRDIRHSAAAAWRFVAGMGFRTACFGRLDTAVGFGWIQTTAAVLQEQSYAVFGRQRDWAAGLILTAGLWPIPGRLINRANKRRERH